MVKQTFKVNKVQRGYWGSTVLRSFAVKAETEAEARARATSRSDHGKRLRNGDYISYELDLF